ncbi:hypothetical protein GCM10011588_30690 [Nocardia jinanensis]|uniref:Uncharacterized protein n=1 Tax=Nocardia jinanensis TaxID=382504 RepID=A0A917RLW2_9NOCA|nr:hypothetical protein GCM10011588_30690 [Nocardia jinanensis]
MGMRGDADLPAVAAPLGCGVQTGAKWTRPRSRASWRRSATSVCEWSALVLSRRPWRVDAGAHQVPNRGGSAGAGQRLRCAADNGGRADDVSAMIDPLTGTGMTFVFTSGTGVLSQRTDGE